MLKRSKHVGELLRSTLREQHDSQPNKLKKIINEVFISIGINELPLEDSSLLLNDK